MIDFVGGVGSRGADAGRDPFVCAVALLPTIGMLRLTGLLLGLPQEQPDQVM